MAASTDMSGVLAEILASIQTLKQENFHLAAAVDAISGKVNILATVKEIQDEAARGEFGLPIQIRVPFLTNNQLQPDRCHRNPATSRPMDQRTSRLLLAQMQVSRL
jgi:hypothetical protein